MAKKDINFIKHIKPQIKAKERQDKASGYDIKKERAIRAIEDKYFEETTRQKEICKRAAKMDPYERLLNFCHTLDGTYLGSGCNWDLVTRWGIKK
jgi:hypothetical protein